LFPGCAAPDSSVDPHLLIVVRRGRGWKIYLGFGLRICCKPIPSIFTIPCVGDLTDYPCTGLYCYILLASVVVRENY